MKNLKLFITSLFICFAFSCVDSAETNRNYIIVNDTDESVTLRFFKENTLGVSSLVFIEQKEGIGVVFERFISVNQRDDGGPRFAFESDSLAMIFNANRILSFTTSFPERNVFSFSDYEQNGDDFTYRITQENFDNAIPCDESCD